VIGFTRGTTPLRWLYPGSDPPHCDKQIAANNAPACRRVAGDVSINRSVRSMIYPSIFRVLYVKPTKMYLAISVTIVSILPFTTISVSETHASEPFEEFPFVITCEYKGLHQAFYLSRLDSDGVATYINPSRRAGTISVYGTAKASGETIGGSCLGKTLEQLRASGQAYDLRR
jgi:hypothetical protein